MRDFSKGDRTKYLQYLTRMALAFRYYEKHVLTEDIPTTEAYYSNKGLDLASKVSQEDMYKDLEKFIADFDEWLDEMSVQKDAFKPFLHNPRDTDSAAPVAEDLDDFIVGYDARQGGAFRDGSSFKDFSSYCNKYYKKYGNSLDNEDYAFLSLFYDAAKDCFEYYNEQ